MNDATDDGTFAAEAAAAWAVLLGWCRGPEPAEETERALRRLIEAAADEPVLRVLCPWLSMTGLNVSTSTDFRVWGIEGFPSVVAWKGEFTVVEGLGRENRVLLETADVAEAVALLAGRVRERRA
ncbi:DUF6193 family natural product biosynthesis protein [Kitasatospora sp. NPDC058444]|uniref:DUF6193 family natural product biosynthesis protein n=1 Tax=Kitasatospora sp. NPDC058444 TaxID=3346504 RepID=UPI0036470EFD